MAATAPGEVAPVSFGFDNSAFRSLDDGNKGGDPTRKPPGTLNSVHRNTGLGTGLGGALTRSALGGAAYAMLDAQEKARQQAQEAAGAAKGLRGQATSAPATSRPAATASPPSGGGGSSSSALPAATPRQQGSDALEEGGELRGMYRELLLGDLGLPADSLTEEERRVVRDSRWTFRAAEELAERSRGFYFFVRCLLELQRNVQCFEEGPALPAEMARACKVFVTGQCCNGRDAEMYQLLTHFISNSVVFDQWTKYLKDAFESPRATQESFLVPHLEQVWSRFGRLSSVLVQIFEVLNSRFVWRHRLPKVHELLREHMKRRCFTSEVVAKNELLGQDKSGTSDTVKDIRRLIYFR